MSRARATALALVNWKGVFYERYLLDRHVTALEGANGAGKTTVMIAAYVVLLPDMSRLRFTNLGESGVTGGDKGVWGRLGVLGRPSYSALEIELPGGERLAAGVQLVRKAEPTLELVPFVVTGPDIAGRLRDLLLVSDGPDEMVPDLDELRANVARAGARIEVFETAKDYFAALFDRGVTPLRMGTDEERNKLNEMLRTSMTGGISRALTTDLRAFLLKAEAGLGEALSRMRANLDACHRTRIEVGEARHLERELVGVYDAGQAMFAASLLAARTAAEEHAALLEQARSRHDDAARAARDLCAATNDARAQHEVMTARLARARAARDEAVGRVDRELRAQSILGRVRDLEQERATATEAACTARAAQGAAATMRETRRRERDLAGEDCDRVARGLADMQRGLEEIHRNVQAYRRAVRRLNDARDALGDPTVDAQTAGAALERSRTALREIDERRAQLDRDLESARVRRAEHERALGALTALVGKVDVPRAHDQARAALARLADLEAGQSRFADLAAERDRALALADRQAAAVGRAAALGVPRPSADASQLVERQLTDAEAKMRAAEEAALGDEARAEAARRARDEARRRMTELDHLEARWREIVTIVERLEAALGQPVRTRNAIAAARAQLAQDREGGRERVAAAKRSRDELLEQAAVLKSPVVPVHPDILRLQGELDAELLAARFEDMPLSDAARVQAELGPLSDALVVEDPVAAARKLAGLDRDLASIWLVGAGAAMPIGDSPADVSLQGPDLVVREGLAVRVTRLPKHPMLGRRAREQRAAEARARADALATEIEGSIDALRAIEALSRDADRLLEEGRVLDTGAPADAIAAIRASLESAEAAEQAALESALAARKRAAALRSVVEKLRALLGEAFLLEPPDHAARAREISQSLTRATEAREELARTEAPRRVLALLIDALRTAPPGEDEVSSRAAARQLLDRERERLFRACEALEEVSVSQGAFAFGALESALTERGAVTPALELQLARARRSLHEQEQALRAAEGMWEQATASAQQADASREAASAQLARLRTELGPRGSADVSESSVAAAQQEVSRLRAESGALEGQERALATEAALLAERSARAMQEADATKRVLTAAQQAARPAAEHWRQASLRAETAGVLREALLARAVDTYEGRTSTALCAEARSRAEVLVDRLAASPAGAECAAMVGEAGSGPSTDAFFEAWLAVRDWIKRRLPAPLGELPEPLPALNRLRDELETLQEQLARQDAALRGESADVARGIDVQLRRAGQQVRRLNQHLDGVRFGSITSIRVQIRRVERMEQVLRALREGDAQELLFRPTMPIEEALDEIFRRYGGGRGGGSNRVLDYREYAELAVEIRRHDRGEWESASPARLSTGEAIGVGAALMMVILSEWERDANLLRTKRAHGSLRFLFLDEANRLSQDNIAVLFDLCEALDLQLLIAAPEVARADGNTTYRLVRHVGADGREEVLVSGRRTVAAGGPLREVPISEDHSGSGG
jgi:chromosome partition protein MukB